MKSEKTNVKNNFEVSDPSSSKYVELVNNAEHAKSPFGSSEPSNKTDYK